ncbi:MAG: ROK family protein [Candidatus Kapabacteria bacterium]|nr:ROK family protein [Ignavibacteriota bacterium]MCW5883892.1 ROK family protein [Candidatus Kapabacteria bacterium]
MLLGIDIGGTSIKAGIFDYDFKLFNKFKIPYLENAKSRDFPEYLIDELFNLINSSIENFPNIEKIGFGVPGVVSREGVIKVAPNMLGIVDFPIKQLIKSRINLPIAIDNDANVAALAELKLGSGLEYQHFVYVTLGTGIGSAIISNSEIFRGSSGGAGEIGHTIIDYTNTRYDSRSYRIGTIEVLAGRQGILNLAAEILPDYPNSKLNDYDNIDVGEIAGDAESGDLAALKILKITGERIGTALVNSANILDIPTFIIGGGISQSQILINEIEKILKLRSIPSISERVKVIKAKFIQDTGIFGAAVLAKYYAN